VVFWGRQEKKEGMTVAGVVAKKNAGRLELMTGTNYSDSWEGEGRILNFAV